jgi:predicted transcriptional regulator
MRLNPTLRGQIRALHAQDLSQKAIAARIGSTQSTVGYYLRNRGESRAPGDLARKRFYTTERLAALERGLWYHAERGMSMERAAKMVGQSFYTLRKYIYNKKANRPHGEAIRKSRYQRTRRAHAESMTKRVGDLVHQGLKGTEIAERLGISNASVSKYRRRYLDSLNIHSTHVKRAA